MKTQQSTFTNQHFPLPCLLDFRVSLGQLQTERNRRKRIDISTQTADADSLLDLTDQGSLISTVNSQTITIQMTFPFRLTHPGRPTLLPFHVPLACLFTHLSLFDLVSLYLILLLEKPVLFLSDRLDVLSTFQHALVSLLGPLPLSTLFIPVLPTDMLDYIATPVPFIIGMHKSAAFELVKHTHTFSKEGTLSPNPINDDDASAQDHRLVSPRTTATPITESPMPPPPQSWADQNQHQSPSPTPNLTHAHLLSSLPYIVVVDLDSHSLLFPNSADGLDLQRILAISSSQQELNRLLQKDSRRGKTATKNGKVILDSSYIHSPALLLRSRLYVALTHALSESSLVTTTTLSAHVQSIIFWFVAELFHPLVSTCIQTYKQELKKDREEQLPSDTDRSDDQLVNEKKLHLEKQYASFVSSPMSQDSTSPHVVPSKRDTPLQQQNSTFPEQGFDLLKHEPLFLNNKSPHEHEMIRTILSSAIFLQFSEEFSNHFLHKRRDLAKRLKALSLKKREQIEREDKKNRRRLFNAAHKSRTFSWFDFETKRGKEEDQIDHETMKDLLGDWNEQRNALQDDPPSPTPPLVSHQKAVTDPFSSLPARSERRSSVWKEYDTLRKSIRVERVATEPIERERKVIVVEESRNQGDLESFFTTPDAPAAFPPSSSPSNDPFESFFSTQTSPFPDTTTTDLSSFFSHPPQSPPNQNQTIEQSSEAPIKIVVPTTRSKKSSPLTLATSPQRSSFSNKTSSSHTQDWVQTLIASMQSNKGTKGKDSSAPPSLQSQFYKVTSESDLSLNLKLILDLLENEMWHIISHRYDPGDGSEWLLSDDLTAQLAAMHLSIDPQSIIDDVNRQDEDDLDLRSCWNWTMEAAFDSWEHSLETDIVIGESDDIRQERIDKWKSERSKFRRSDNSKQIAEWKKERSSQKWIPRAVSVFIHQMNEVIPTLPDSIMFE
ncbi:putative DENN (AEX-3) domain containing protein [Blattamonas nauphoetae]|uniref:DENN (AEX-3) domain containing protein n=1 Tax=Blattamonas nauphoetae TaxID=2049346 RepID=A0ABQ9Y1T5_9EUKA|nr:putative DENN (AEX-3) domain containing protein [Blattamonas nauphoetae]